MLDHVGQTDPSYQNRAIENSARRLKSNSGTTRPPCNIPGAAFPGEIRRNPRKT
jgi:hypothetical protein